MDTDEIKERAQEPEHDSENQRPEKLGRARLIIAGDEPGSLGLVLTLEGLTMGVTGKKLMWDALAAAKLPRLNSYDFEQLQHRAEQLIERIEAERISVVHPAFAGAIRSK